MNPQTYGQQYALAMALGRPLPSVFDVGDVEPEPEPTTTAISPENVKTALQNVSGLVWLSLGAGVVGGFAIGYFAGRWTK